MLTIHTSPKRNKRKSLKARLNLIPSHVNFLKSPRLILKHFFNKKKKTRHHQKQRNTPTMLTVMIRPLMNSN